jgi:hypothetical protein
MRCRSLFPVRERIEFSAKIPDAVSADHGVLAILHSQSRRSGRHAISVRAASQVLPAAIFGKHFDVDFSANLLI